VAGQRHLQAAAQGRAVDSGHHGLRRPFDEIEHLVEPGLAGWFAELGDISARDERATGAGDHDGADGSVGHRLLEPVAQPQPHAVAERVDGRVVDDEDGNAAAPVEVDELGDRCHGTPLSVWSSLTQPDG
jgi:hypothetical protein